MNSHSSGCTERVTTSRWSWRSFRSSAWAIASVPSARRTSGPDASAAGRGLAEPACGATLCADIAEPPFLLALAAQRVAGDGREHLFEALGAAALDQLAGLALLDEPAGVDHAEPVAVALGLLHQVGGDEDRRA